MGKIITCPNCGSTSVSRTVSGHAKRAAATAVGYGIGAVVNGIANSFLPFDTHATGQIAKAVKSIVPIDYECIDCDCLLSVEFTQDGEIATTKLKKLPMPEEIIQKEKDAYIKEIKSSISYFGTIATALISIALFVYCWQAEFKYQRWQEETWLTKAQYVTDYHYGWLFWAFLFLIFFIITIAKYSSLSEKRKEVALCEALSLREFKHDHRELFEKYSQYN